MTGTQLETFCTELNGGASIGSTLLFQLVNLGRAMIEQRRPWMILRSTDTSKSISAGGTWQTAIDLSTITRFNRFYGDFPVRIFDGSNRVEELRQVPFEERLSYKDEGDTFVYDEASQILYLNGTRSSAGTLYINHLKNGADAATGETSVWAFPSWSHGILGYLAVAMHKGGVDYDDINARMSPENRADAERIMRALEAWDSEKQLSAISTTDPSGNDLDGFRPNAINIPR